MTHPARILIAFALVLSLSIGGVASAHETAEVHVENSLGTGISHMVRNILGDTLESDELLSEDAQTSIMMDTGEARMLQAETLAPDEPTAGGLSAFASIEAEADSQQTNGIIVFFKSIGDFILELFRR